MPGKTVMKPKDVLCVFLVRHGQTDWNVEQRVQGSKGVPLNKTGVEQAKRTAKKFKRITLTHIYSSPVLRAKQTALIVARSHKLKVRYDSNLRERSFGVLEGMTRDEWIKKYPGFVDEWKRNSIDWRAPKGETVRETMKRSLAVFKKIISSHLPGDRVLIVSHGSALRCLTHLLHGGKPKDYWHSASLDNAEIVEVHWDGKKAKIVSSYK